MHTNGLYSASAVQVVKGNQYGWNFGDYAVGAVPTPGTTTFGGFYTKNTNGEPSFVLENFVGTAAAGTNGSILLTTKYGSGTAVAGSGILFQKYGDWSAAAKRSAGLTFRTVDGGTVTNALILTNLNAISAGRVYDTAVQSAETQLLNSNAVAAAITGATGGTWNATNLSYPAQTNGTYMLSPGSTPVNQITPVGWASITITGVVYQVPLYQ